VPPGVVVLTSLDVGEAEQALITRALAVTGGNRTHAARLLGISVRTLRNKLNLRSAAVSARDKAPEAPSD
jgi:DNA-binding NtrC family response regulator